MQSKKNCDHHACAAVPEKFFKKCKKTVFIINKKTRTIRRVSKEKLQFILVMSVGSEVEVLNRWPTEKQYFDFTGEW